MAVVLPVEVIGRILSHLASVRHVALASATCRLWQEAAKHHCCKLSFDWDDQEEDVASFDDLVSWDMVVITQTVLQRTCLCELSISTYDIEEAALVAWLLCTRQRLRSLELSVKCTDGTQKIDILSRFGYCKVALECLVLQYPYLPTNRLNPTIHGLPSLVSLTICGSTKGLHQAQDIEVLLSLFPKLEFLSLINLWMPTSSARHELHIPPSLKKLHLKGLFVNWMPPETYLCLMLYGENLRSLSLDSVCADSLTVFGHCLECLDIRDYAVRELISPNQLSLRDLTGEVHEDAALVQFWAMIASMKLNKLRIGHFDCVRGRLGYLFPCVRQLTITGWLDKLSKQLEQSIKFEKLFTPELQTHVVHIFAESLRGFPCLKWLTVVGDNKAHFSCLDWAPCLNHLRHLYPHIDIRFRKEEMW